MSEHNNQNVLKVRVASSGNALNISATDIRQTVSATNNRAQYFADLAKKYKDEAKISRDEAQYYAEQNSDVTFEYIDGIKAELEGEISLKQDIGNYALRSEIPVNVSDLTNDADYVSETQMQTAVDGVLPSQTSQNGKFLTTNGSNVAWAIPKTFNLLDFKWSDCLLNDQNWLRADTFSWQSGTTYSEAYGHLVDDIEDKELQSETISGVTIQYYLADDGHKICPASQESNVISIYSATGVAWYYILDTTNTRFKLPRTKQGFVGLVDQVGKNSLIQDNVNYPDYANGTNLTKATYTVLKDGWIYAIVYSNTGATISINSETYSLNGAYYTTPFLMYPVKKGDVITSNTWGNVDKFIFYPSRKGSNKDKDTQMYLYFYVGQYSQTATEQTAGLNAELFNGKADLDLSNANLSQSVKENFATLSMPSSSYINLTFGASGTQYTMPADGWFYFNGIVNAYSIKFASDRLSVSGYASTYNLEFSLIMPVRKGDIVTQTNQGSVTATKFRFIYAEGVQ